MTVADLAAISDEQLAAVDPLAMNLIVAKGVPSLAALDIRHYQDIVDGWVLELNRRCLPRWEPFFHKSPQDWENDIRYFRLGMVCQYLDLEVGIQYNQHQRDVPWILYTTPSDVFLNGVLDTREGTCGTMAALHVAMGWRMGWPVSLACVVSHYILRFDDGEVIYNIEATQAGHACQLPSRIALLISWAASLQFLSNWPIHLATRPDGKVDLDKSEVTEDDIDNGYPIEFDWHTHPRQ
ncbi:MAG: hypothetical protein J5I93_10115 [Pirellulaceae bacterium]|nr:hypothetical protein [Pirellulaceae bacterium]